MLGTEDGLEFEWDEANVGHIARHGVRPEEVEQVILNDPDDIGYEEANGENRWSIIGHTKQMRVLMVVFTMRGNRFRAVTSRRVSRRSAIRYLRVKGLYP
jgi:hypothetical protein